MRKIKFRVWDKRDKEMRFVNSLDYIHHGQTPWVTCDDGRRFEVEELLQFTGLNDKNGKEIYEKDILKYGDDEDEIIIQVVWNDLSDNGFRVLSQRNKNVLHDIRTYRFDINSEIIGNPYENPDLIVTTA